MRGKKADCLRVTDTQAVDEIIDLVRDTGNLDLLARWYSVMIAQGPVIVSPYDNYCSESKPFLDGVQIDLE